jgi:NhaA family Na+:H+ antiporter
VAVDIVFCYCIARALFRHRGAILFTLMLAVATDIVVLPLVTVSYAFAEPHAWGYLVILAAVVMAAVMRRSGVRSVWAYVLGCGALSWWGFVLRGMYPSLALVLIVPFIPHRARETDLLGPGSARRHGSHLEQKLEYPVHIVLFLFALINAGVIVQSFEPGTWAIPIAALAGRSLGIMVFVAGALLIGCRLPRFMAGRDLVVVAIIASVGFTFALFVATAVLPIGSLLTQTKMGALSTVGGALIAALAAWVLKVGEFAPRPERQDAHGPVAPHAS